MNDSPIRNRAALLAVLFLLGIAAKAQDAHPAGLPRAAPTEAGLSEAGLDKIGALMQTMVADGELVGAVTLVARHGKVVHLASTGKQGRDQDAPMSEDTIFRIYSMTKPIAGVALMTFYDEGAFTLDDPVAKFIPEFKGLKVAAGDGPGIADRSSSMPTTR